MKIKDKLKSRKSVVVFLMFACVVVASMFVLTSSYENIIFVFLILLIIGALIPNRMHNQGKSRKKLVLIIIGLILVLAGIGINMKEGFMTNAIINATTTNHTNAKLMITSQFEKCSTGSTTITLGTTSLTCSSSLPALTNSFSVYFNSIINNPYKADVQAFEFKAGNPTLGSSNIYYSGNNITIITNFGDEDGGDAYLNDTIVRD